MLKKVMVLGSGFMGSGIAQVSAAAGLDVLLWDLNMELVEKGLAKITASLDGRVAKGKMTQETKAEILSHLIPCTEMERAAEADLIIEVVVENEDIKLKVLAEAESFAREDAFFATNTSYIPISFLATSLKRPERFIGLHFFAPVPAMKLLEIIRGEKTSDETLEMGLTYGKIIGKTTVVVNKDTPGFVVNRVNAALRLEAYRILHDGIASVEDIDKALKLGLNHPMGPFELNDMSGLELGLSGLETMYKRTGEERWKPTPEVYELVGRGEYGRKTGKGWYDYTDGEQKPRPDLFKK